MFLNESLLDRMKLSLLLQPFDGHQPAPVGLNGKEGARFDRPAVEQDGAGAAVAGVASDVGAGQPEDLPDEVDQKEAAALPPIRPWPR